MKPVLPAILTGLCLCLPAAAQVVPADTPVHSSPDGRIHVQFLTGPQTAHGQGAAVNRLTLDPGALVPEHRHAEGDEILVVHSGRGVLTLDGQRYAVSPGETVFIPRNALHAFAVEGSEPAVMTQIYAPAGPEARFKAWPARQTKASP